MNKVILMGRLARDPEIRQTAQGTNVARFTIAISRRFQSQKEGAQTADFINCVAWRQHAEFVTKFFKKGSMIAVVGSLQSGSYERDGQTHYTTEVVVDEAHFTGSKAETGTGDFSATYQAPAAPAPASQKTDNLGDAELDGFIVDSSEDDLPF